MVLSLDRSEHYVFLYLLGILRVMIWIMHQKEFLEGKPFSSWMLVAIYNHQIKNPVARMCLVIGTGLEFFLEVAGRRILHTWKDIDNQVTYTSVFCLVFVKIGLT